MAFVNPFTPAFGSRPEHFFGRTSILARVRASLLGDGDVPDRVLFFTGPRGCGKTALLERLSRLAVECDWLTVDVHSVNAIQDILLGLSPARGVRVSLAPEVKAFGATVALGKADSAQSMPSGESLTTTLLARFDSLGRKRGVFITIDEIQKIAAGDMEQVCNAVQMTRRKGCPVALMLAGLPGSKERVASYPGCTFMQRVRDERMGSLLVEETVDAFSQTLALVPALKAPSDAIWSAAAHSQGYPYLVQLVGYHIINMLHQEYPVGELVLAPEHVDAVAEEVYETYRQDVLVPSLRSLGTESRAYLSAMARLLDEMGIASTGEIARTMGKTLSQLSSCRQTLIDHRLIRSAGYGKVSFGLPYLSRFAVEPAPEPNELSPHEWVIR